MEEGEFRFKRFAVRQRDCAMKVGTDGVLLGAWCDVSDADRILDVGTGCGLIALMAAQKNESARIDAVEIDHASVEEARFNFSRTPWSGRIRAFHGDFLEFIPPEGEAYDLIVSNPPFFVSGQVAPDRRRAAARHADGLPFDRLLGHGAGLLSAKGRIAIVAPAEARSTIEFLAGEHDLWIRRRLAVRPLSGKPVRRYLWEFSKDPAEMREESIVLAQGNGMRTWEYAALTDDFYLW